jgi:hypothetical protein
MLRTEPPQVKSTSRVAFCLSISANFAKTKIFSSAEVVNRAAWVIKCNLIYSICPACINKRQTGWNSGKTFRGKKADYSHGKK